MASTLYDSIYGTNSSENEINYTSETPTTNYPDSAFANVSGTLFLPRIYGKDLTYLEIGSSGKIAVTLTDIHSFDIANSNNVVYFTAENAEAFSIQPKDAQKTVHLGEFTTSSSNNYQQFDTTESLGFNFVDNVNFSTPITATDLALSGDADFAKTLQVTGEVSLSNNLNVEGNTDINGTLDVQQSSILRDTLNVVGATDLDSTLNVDGESYLVGAVGMSNTLHVVGATDLDSTLNVDGESYLVGAVGMSNTLHVVGATDLDSTLNVDGTTTLVGAATLSSTLNVVGATDLDSTLNVDGESYLVGAVGMSNTLHVVGATDFDSTLNVDGTTTLVGAATLNSSLNVQGTTDLDSTLNVDGETFLIGAVGMSNTLNVVGATDLDSTLNVDGAVTLSNTLLVLGESTFSNNMTVTGNAAFTSNVSIKDLTITGNLVFEGELPAVFADLTVTGSSLLQGPVVIDDSVSISNNLLLEGSADFNSTLDVQDSTTLRSTLDVEGNVTLSNTLQVYGAVAFSNTLNVDGVSTFNSSTYFGVTDGGVNSPSVFVGIGTVSPLVSLDLSDRTDAIALPVGGTATRPDAPETGYVRYNTDLSTFEGYGTTNWGSLGGVKDVNQDTYISAEDTPGVNNDQLKFYTNNLERMIIDADGSVGIGTNLNPEPGDYELYVKGKTHFDSSFVVMNQNLTVGSTVKATDLAITDSAGVSNNLTVGGQIVASDFITGQEMTFTASNIVFRGDVQITGSLDTIATETITVEDLYITLASAGEPQIGDVYSSNIRRDGGLNNGAGIQIEGIPDGFEANASNVKYYEKSIRWQTGGSNAVQSYDKSTSFADDPYFETLGGSFQISRYSSNMGYDFVTGSDYDVSKISFMLRINANEELEIVKVRENKAGVRTGKVVQRLGVNMPLLNV